jgi:hypothetical protein
MCEIHKVGFEGADPTYGTRRPSRVTCTFRKLCSRLSGNGFAAVYWVKAACWGRVRKMMWLEAVFDHRGTLALMG